MSIVDLYVEHLGGIPGGLRITIGHGTIPSSLVLFGDNGKGKSSVVDAIEFGLQGRVRRTGRPTDVLKTIESLACPRAPMVRIAVLNGEEVERRFNLNHGTRIVPTDPHPAYSVAPVALRRNDVTRFWDTPEAQRQVLFRGLFQNPAQGQWIRLGDEEERRLEAQRASLKKERRSHMSTLLKPLDSIPHQVPRESVEVFDDFVRKSFDSTFGKNWPTSGPSDDPEDRERFEAAVAVRRLTGNILDVQRKLRSSAAAPVGQTTLGDVLRTAGAELASAFAKISDITFVQDVRLDAGGTGDVSLSIRVRMPDGRWVAPETILSEANLDLLALLVFTSVAKGASDHGQDKLLVLDDVVQSVDATIRSRFFEYLMTGFADWQLVVTTHDRLWREQALDIFRRHNKPVEAIDIVDWTFADGPVLRGYLGSKVERLRRAIVDCDDAVVICSGAGIALEELCQQLSWRLNVKIVRARHDKYMLGDLWPPVADQITKLGAGGLVAEVARSLNLRNLVGAHYVEWAQSMSDTEARDFGTAVSNLIDAVRCQKCSGWIKRSGAIWSCGCGATVMSPT